MRTIYVNPGETLDIRVITDSAEPKTATSWKWQRHPRKMFIKIEGVDSISFHDPIIRVARTDMSGKVLAYF